MVVELFVGKTSQVSKTSEVWEKSAYLLVSYHLVSWFWQNFTDFKNNEV
jgi:hypothetical protein